MTNKLDGFFKSMFLIAALYDFVLGLVFFLFYGQIYSYLNIPIPAESMYLQMAAAFVIAMGVGYYFVYQNMYKNIDLVKLGVVYKFVYSSVTSYFYFKGSGPAIFFLFAVIDAVFLLLFVWFLFYAKKANKNEHRQ